MNIKLNRPLPEYWNDIACEIDSSILTCISIKSSCGGEIICYQAGDCNSKPLIIVPPLHMPVAALSYIIDCFAKDFFVISYEVRGGAFLGSGSENGGPHIKNLVSDFADVYQAFHRPEYVFGWCNSARVIAKAVSLKLALINKLVFLAPSGITGECSPRYYAPSIFGRTHQLTEAEITRAKQLFQQSMASAGNLSKEDLMMSKIFGLNFNSGEKFRAFVSAKLARNASQDYDVKADITALFSFTKVLIILPDEDYHVLSSDVIDAVRHEPNVTIYNLCKSGHAPVLSHSNEIVSESNAFYLF